MSDTAVTDLLRAWRGGDKAAESALMAAIYPVLRELAQHQLARVPGTRTLQATELVHEAYERLHRQNAVDWQNRGHFYAIAATVIRHVLVDHLRQKNSQKRGGDVIKIEIDAQLMDQVAQETPAIDWLELDSALTALQRVNGDCVRVVEMRVFGGLSVDEVAEVLESSAATVGRQWRFARAWLAERLAP
jgi:RNA polymerase sigma factor (TIGR02999 family)